MRCWFVETETHTRSTNIDREGERENKKRKWTKCKMCQTKQEPYSNFMCNFPFGLTSGESFNFLNFLLAYDKTTIYTGIVWRLLRTMMNDEHDEKYKM